ncbi:hypothetical protein P280DRAFT_545926 [Massarina eburnea CBS 473.64]|uniref:F-box domain-containing protein n=1 Tax=Massarina eburnea CBS 473.64 TaxID=1395130 RepID=A0A6A6S9N1_9PLEO|nr:hypothetical protein P280DRAFT_545926 [Massarina eburnea CBS 473.64]
MARTRNPKPNYPPASPAPESNESLEIQQEVQDEEPVEDTPVEAPGEERVSTTSNTRKRRREGVEDPNPSRPKQSGFFSLPGELRNSIYGLARDDELTGLSTQLAPEAATPREFLSFAQTNQQIRDEFFSIWKRHSVLQIREDLLQTYFETFEFTVDTAPRKVLLEAYPRDYRAWRVGGKSIDITDLVMFAAMYNETDWSITAKFGESNYSENGICLDCNRSVCADSYFYEGEDGDDENGDDEQGNGKDILHCTEHADSLRYWEREKGLVEGLNWTFESVNHIFANKDPNWIDHVNSGIIDSIHIETARDSIFIHPYSNDWLYITVAIFYTRKGARRTPTLRREDRPEGRYPEDSKYWKHFGFTSKGSTWYGNADWSVYVDGVLLAAWDGSSETPEAAYLEDTDSEEEEDDDEDEEEENDDDDDEEYESDPLDGM